MPTIYDDNSKRVLFDPDGEGVDFTDNNNMQLFQQRRDWVALFASALANGAGDPLDPGAYGTPEAFIGYSELSLYGGAPIALHPGAGYVSAGGANKLIINAGTIALVVDEPWNTGEDFATFRIASYLELTTGVGDAAQPRIDIVEVKIAYGDDDPQDRHFEDAITREPTTQSGVNKERRALFTYQIKAGTPAANPTYPTPTSGFVAMAAVYVPALHNAVHSPSNIRDLRMPVGIRCIDVDLKGMFFTGSNPWTNLGMLAVAAAASDPDADRVIVPCPIATKSARLIAVGVQAYSGNDPRCEIGYITYPDGGAPVTFTKLGNLGNLSIFGDGLMVADGIQIADEIADTAVVKGLRDAASRTGTALWCNGRPGGMAHAGVAFNDGAEDNVTKLALSIGGAVGDRLGFVRFWIAEGL